jgi:hypothetical protein
MDKKAGPLLVIFLALFLFGISSLLPSNSGGSGKGVSLDGTLLLCIHEKQRPSVDEVIAIREAKSFVEKHGFTGWLVIDQDDPNWQEVIKLAASRDITPPLLAAAEADNKKVSGLRKVVKWEKGLEDILR